MANTDLAVQQIRVYYLYYIEVLIKFYSGVVLKELNQSVSSFTNIQMSLIISSCQPVCEYDLKSEIFSS